MNTSNRYRRIALSLLASALLASACTSSEGAAPNTTTEDAGVTVPEGGIDAGDGGSDDGAQQAAANAAMHDALMVDLDALLQAAKDLHAAAPAPSDRGWDATQDAAALATMRASWIRARTAYEHIEGALAPLFPDIDTAIDARYDDFLANLAGAGDADPFDDRGVTGMHAIERILFAGSTPARVVTFEESLTGYAPARAPATAAEAKAFKEGLAAKLVSDVEMLVTEWTPAHIDIEIAYSGLVSLVAEQEEKVLKASTNEEESRYSQRTMTDLRDNLYGTKNAYLAFRPWLLTKDGGGAIDARINAAFTSLDQAYAEVTGEAIPVPPDSWSAENPSPADLATPFGRLYAAVRKQADRDDPASLVSELGAARERLGLRDLE